MRSTSWLLSLLFATAAGCYPKQDTGIVPAPAAHGGGGGGVGGGGSASPAPPDTTPQSVSLTGQLVDYASQSPLAVGSVTAYGVWPPLQIDLYPDHFTVQDVPQNTTLWLMVTTDGHLPTSSLPIRMGASNRTGVDVPVLPSGWVSDLAAQLAITPAAGTGAVIVQLLGNDGLPLAGVSRTAFTLDAAADGPYLLDEQGKAAPSATVTSASGRAVFFGVAPGQVTVISTSSGLNVGGTSAVVTAGGAALASAQVATVE